MIDSTSALVSSVEDVSTSPVGRLPLEILEFVFCLSCSGERPGRQASKAPVAISQVSRWWRFVAINKPSLWTNIYWKVEAWNRPIQSDKIAAQIARSAHLPLTLHLAFPDWYNLTESNTQQLDVVVNTVKPAFPRVERLYAISETWLPANRLLLALESKRKCMPLLKNVAVLVDPAYVTLLENPPAVRRSFSAVPGELTLLGTQLDWERARFSNLTALTLKVLQANLKPQLDDLQHALWSCSETLVYLELEGLINYFELPDVEPSAEDSQASDGDEVMEEPHDDLHGSLHDSFDVDLTISEIIDGMGAANVADEENSDEEEEEEARSVPTDFMSADDKIVFPNLVELRLGFSHPIEGIALLKLVAAPNLRRLHFRDTRNMGVDYDEEDDPHYCNLALKYLSVSHPLPLAQLEHVQLEGIHYVSRYAVCLAFLERCTAMHSLRVDRCCSSFHAPTISYAPPADPSVDNADEILLGNPNLTLRSISVRAMDLHRALQPFLAYADAAQDAGHTIVPLSELILDYESNDRHLVIDNVLSHRAIIARTVIARQWKREALEDLVSFDAEERSFVAQQERALGLAEELAPERIYTRTFPDF
ncbi:hypothetical protein BV25DRAFT_1545784 [Artomyces pyxidatus]|uniref:Uncharacterized protein n=1 Tax=Artomyces pyxidatus TaxID=48021 RepID=A0ACB8SJG6_9AGAM|nr:hypothetical protein BV25DRAFT_1545784 [Artomyces pyxidatus]